MIHWAAVILASLSWLFAFHDTVGEDRARQWALLLVAMLLGTLAWRGWAARLRFGTRYLAMLFPVAVALLYADQPYRPALLLFGVGVAFLVMGSHVTALSSFKSAGLSVLLVGIVLIVQSPVHWCYTAWTARSPDVPYVASLVHLLLKWVGFDAATSGETVFVRLMREVHVFPPTWNHLAAFPIILVWLAGVLLIALDRTNRPLGRRLTMLSAVLLAYAIFRFFLMILVFVAAMIFVEYREDTVHVEVFWLPWITALSLLPLIPILGRLVPGSSGRPPVPEGLGPTHSDKRQAAVCAWVCVACAGLVIGAFFRDPGAPKAGRLLLDESHSRWERTDNVYDTDWYGHESGYNYYCMAQYLGHFFNIDFNMDEALSPEKLAACDVLILKTPTETYSPEELRAIDDFVRRGGGLLVLGEHTNVFGSSVYLNPVVRPYGIAFRYDIVLDIERKWEQLIFPPRLGSHPIIQHAPLFRFAVSSSIETNDWSVQPVIRGHGLWTLPIEYASGNFYPRVEDAAYARFGSFDQMVSATAGRGRVVAFSDSTVYSNFLAFYPGKPEILLSAVDWLNRTNRWNWINVLGYLVFVAALVAAVWTGRRLLSHVGATAATAAAAAGAVWLTLWVCSAHARSAYPLPAPHKPVHNIVFEMDHSTYELPVFAFTMDYPNSYAVFYQWVLRLGYFESISFDLDKALRATDPIVLIKPTRPFSPETFAAVRGYLEKGGSLLLLDQPDNTDSTANALINAFGMSLTPGHCRGRTLMEPASGARICAIRSGQAVEGGTVLLTTDADVPIVAYTKVGKGQLIVAGLADRFNDTQMGGSSRTVPDRKMRSVYEVEFTLLRGLVQGDLPAEVRALGRTYAAPAD